MFLKIREAVAGFMLGRNGVDQLAWAECIAGIVLNLLGSFTGLALFTLLAYIPLAFALFRILSRNLDRRHTENEAFLQFFARIRGRRYYRYFNCPDCRTKVRVPKGKGRLKITCPACRNAFIKKT